MKTTEALEKLVQQYQECIHTQDKDSFYSIWSKEKECSLISIGTKFIGIDSIYQHFLIDGIQAAYESIDLIAEDLSIRLLDDYHAIILFQYHTECIRRETKEYYSIQGLETQLAILEDSKWKLVHVHYSKI